MSPTRYRPSPHPPAPHRRAPRRAAVWLTVLSLGVAVGAAPVAHGAGAVRTARAGRAGELARLRSDVERAIAGSSASHVALLASVDGLGSFGLDPGGMSRPASNEKLFTAETALRVLGPDYRWRTRIGYTGTRRGATLTGSIVVIGSGDPLLGVPGVNQLGRDVRLAGIRTVLGGLLVDQGRYQLATTAPGWQPGFVPEQLGPLDAFAVDEDSLSVAPAYVHDPAQANGGLLLDALRESGVRLRGAVSVVDAVRGFHPLALLRSRSLVGVLDEMLNVSDNFVAEMLLDELGAHVFGDGTRTRGLAVVAAQCRALRCQDGRLFDGSGLSYDDLESPHTLVGWLSLIAASATGADLEAALPPSCERGTLRQRLCGRGLTGRVHAKTGTLDGVSALSGYARDAAGQQVTFSILLQGIGDPGTALAKMDAAVAQLVHWDN